MTKRIFITGGASGLGKAIAERYARAGCRVCIGDINQSEGEKVAEELNTHADDAFFAKCNVTSYEDLTHVHTLLKQRWGGVDIVVNNAGVAGTAGAIEDVPMKDWDWIVDINVLGPVRLCHIFVDDLKKQGSGHIVNIASAAGLMNAPRMSNYNVSKAALISLSETLRVELDGTGVGVSVICPGFFPTNLANSIRCDDGEAKEWIEKVMDKTGVTAHDVANDIFRAVENNVFWVHPHTLERRMWKLKRWLPELFFKQMAKRSKKLFQLKKKDAV